MTEQIKQPPRVFTPRKDPITPAAPKPERKETDKVILDRAVKSMEGMYALLSMAFTIAGLSETLNAWEDAQGSLEANNREALAATPKLAAQLAQIGETTGALAFVTGNVLAIAPVVQLARKEFASKRAPKAGDFPADEYTQPEPAPGVVFPSPVL